MSDIRIIGCSNPKAISPARYYRLIKKVTLIHGSSALLNKSLNTSRCERSFDSESLSETISFATSKALRNVDSFTRNHNLGIEAKASFIPNLKTRFITDIPHTCRHNRSKSDFLVTQLTSLMSSHNKTIIPKSNDSVKRNRAAYIEDQYSEQASNKSIPFATNRFKTPFKSRNT